MIVAKFFASASKLAQFLRGSTVRYESNTGKSNSVSDTILEDSDSSIDFEDEGVVATDTVYVSGEGEFIVSSVSGGQITLGSALSAAGLSGLSYRIVDTDTIIDTDNIIYLSQHSYDVARWDLVFDSETFKV